VRKYAFPHIERGQLLRKPFSDTRSYTATDLSENNGVTKVVIKMPSALAEDIDREAAVNGVDRSVYLRSLLIAWMEVWANQRVLLGRLSTTIASPAALKPVVDA
jgi:hypothetical protein